MKDSKKCGQNKKLPSVSPSFPGKTGIFDDGCGKITFCHPTDDCNHTYFDCFLQTIVLC